MGSAATQVGESITLEQLAEHSTIDSMWIAVHGHVYNLSTFSSDHPGGIEALESCAGTDGTEAYEYASHSEENMAKMQQYRIGKLIGHLGQPSPISHKRLSAENKCTKRTSSTLKHLQLPSWAKLAITMSATSLVAALCFPYISSTLQLPELLIRTITDHRMGNAFWAGIWIASSFSFLIFRYFYKLFLSTLDYENDVFSFPPTIPRRSRT